MRGCSPFTWAPQVGRDAPAGLGETTGTRGVRPRDTEAPARRARAPEVAGACGAEPRAAGRSQGQAPTHTPPREHTQGQVQPGGRACRTGASLGRRTQAESQTVRRWAPTLCRAALSVLGPRRPPFRGYQPQTGPVGPLDSQELSSDVFGKLYFSSYRKAACSPHLGNTVSHYPEATRANTYVSPTVFLLNHFCRRVGTCSYTFVCGLF